ncbi:E3 ubiquitin-protein ligase HACE1-like [Sycon ciliatum]|uniref:E3 ubiquitin-protein ligase HACE1-like n=1 Tax=Sycon ciliatum TaxID=27933 RepID=UPI0031F64B49
MAFSNPYAPVFECDVDRDNVLDSAVSQLLDVPCSELLRNFPSIAFLNEPGICTGPKREFLSALSREIAADRHALFIQCDDHHYMPRPVAIFQQVAPVKSSRNKLKKANLNIDLSTRRDKFMMIGRLLASAFAHGYQVDFSMAKPLIKQLLGRSLNHPHELRHVDSNLHRTTVQYLMDHPVAGVLDDLVFCCELELPLGSHGDLVEFPLARNGDSNLVTDSNKSSYVYRLSKFKLEDSIAYEVKCLVHGFCEVVPRALLSPFRPAEFQLLLCGVSTIDVEDWKKHTRYAGFNASDACICWFWEVVASLSQEERSLLLQFATSLTRLPAQGFAGLKGLGNTHGFTVSEARRPKSMIPMASTCFNRLDLPRYTSKSELRDKVLIAVRHGSQGFSFA